MKLLYYGNESGRAAKSAQNVPKKVSVECLPLSDQRRPCINLDAVHNIFSEVAGQQICQLRCVLARFSHDKI